MVNERKNSEVKVTAAGNHSIAFPANNSDVNRPCAKRNHIDKGRRVDHHDIAVAPECRHIAFYTQIVLRRKPGAITVASDFHGRRESGNMALFFK